MKKSDIFVFVVVMLCMTSCGVNHEKLVKSAVAEAQEMSFEKFAPLGDFDIPMPTAELARLKYEYEEALSCATYKLALSYNPNYMEEQRLDLNDAESAKYYEQYENVLRLLDNYYTPKIQEEISLIVGTPFDVYCMNGMTDIEAVIEQIPGTLDVRVKIEGTMTTKGSTAHYSYDNALTWETKIGAIKLLHDRQGGSYASLEGERVRCYYLMNQWYDMVMSAINITRIN
ncbi:MAG: hypothetical protein IKM58_04115 [Tidjanibacter sp.]|nr:hypothetical protein [Tidjanibacter sp.]